MNHRSNKLLPALAASLSLLTLPVLAQNSGSSGSGSRPAPSTSRSDRDQRPIPPDSTRSGSGSSMSDSSNPGADSSYSRGSELNSRSHTGIRGNISFDQVDTDSDGRISRSEYTNSSSFKGGASERSSASGQASTRGSLSSSGSQGGQDVAESFRRLDTNGDGYLSRDEVKGGQLNRLHGKQQPSQP